MIAVPSVMRISENDLIRSGLGVSACASVSICPTQFDEPSDAKAIMMVGRTSVTSAISMRPNRKERNRSRTSNCSAESAGAPVRLSPRLTSLKRTLPVGNSETDTSPRSTGSRPVTSLICALTASRTVSAGITTERIERRTSPAPSRLATAIPTRLMPVAAVT